MLKELGDVDVVRIKDAVIKWILVALKVISFSSIWLTIIPLLIGVAFEAIAVVPLRTAMNETPKYPIVQCWALGLVFLKIWTRCLLLGGFGENAWRARFERVINQGFLRMDIVFIFNDIVSPVFFTLADFVIIPYFLARLAGVVLDLSYETKSLIIRYSFASFAFLRIAAHTFKDMMAMLTKLHNDIRDSRYLVGTELTNR
jgi:hypothetical protein